MENSLTRERIKDTPLIITRHNASFWQITFNNPPLNIFSPELLDGLEQLMDMIRNEPELKVIVFDSAVENYFIAHFDVVRGGEILNRKTKSGLLPWFDVVQALFDSPVISIASIRGRARGVGIEFAVACDMRFASREKAIFGQFEVAVATIPGGGSMEQLPLLTGRSRALEIIIGGEDINADIAERYGLINRAIPDNELDEFVYHYAMRVARFDKAITGKAKAMINARAGGGARMEDMAESRRAFIEASLRPERKPVSQKLMEWGIQTDGDFELNPGQYLSGIGENIR